jgi:hypothetical protein
MRHKSPLFTRPAKARPAPLPAGWRYAEPNDNLWVDSVLAIGGQLIHGVYRGINKSTVHFVGRPATTLQGEYSQVVVRRKHFEVYQELAAESGSRPDLHDE